jgi:hypothetical protein
VGDRGSWWSRYKSGGKGLLLLACFMEILEKGLENFVVGDRVVIVEVVVGRSLLLNVELLYGIEVDVLFCGNVNLHGVLYVSECMSFCC